MQKQIEKFQILGESDQITPPTPPHAPWIIICWKINEVAAGTHINTTQPSVLLSN